MSNVVEGVVRSMMQKRGNTNGRDWTMYNAVVATEDGENQYGFGFNKPEFSEGQFIRFKATQKGKYWNVVDDSVEVIKDREPPKQVTQQVQAAVQAGDARQASICLQTAFKVASQMAHSMIESGYTPLAANASKANKYDYYLELTDDLARRMFERFTRPIEFVNSTGNGTSSTDDYEPID